MLKVQEMEIKNSSFAHLRDISIIIQMYLFIIFCEMHEFTFAYEDIHRKLEQNVFF